jgi:DNA-binding protein YbaB
MPPPLALVKVALTPGALTGIILGAILSCVLCAVGLGVSVNLYSRRQYEASKIQALTEVGQTVSALTQELATLQTRSSDIVSAAWSGSNLRKSSRSGARRLTDAEIDDVFAASTQLDVELDEAALEKMVAEALAAGDEAVTEEEATADAKAAAQEEEAQVAGARPSAVQRLRLPSGAAAPAWSIDFDKDDEIVE